MQFSVARLSGKESPAFRHGENVKITPPQMKRLNDVLGELLRRGYKVKDNDTGLKVYPNSREDTRKNAEKI
jgi:hypothetical protein